MWPDPLVLLPVQEQLMPQFTYEFALSCTRLPLYFPLCWFLYQLLYHLLLHLQLPPPPYHIPLCSATVAVDSLTVPMGM